MTEFDEVLCREAGISNKSVLVQVARAGSEAAMEQVVRGFAAGELSRDDLRRQTSSKPEPKKAEATTSCETR